MTDTSYSDSDSDVEYRAERDMRDKAVLRVWGYFMGSQDPFKSKEETRYEVTIESHDMPDGSRQIDLSQPNWFRTCPLTKNRKLQRHEMSSRTQVRLDGLSMADDWEPVHEIVDFEVELDHWEPICFCLFRKSRLKPIQGRWIGRVKVHIQPSYLIKAFETYLQKHQRQKDKEASISISAPNSQLVDAPLIGAAFQIRGRRRRLVRRHQLKNQLGDGANGVNLREQARGMVEESLALATKGPRGRQRRVLRRNKVCGLPPTTSKQHMGTVPVARESAKVLPAFSPSSAMAYLLDKDNFHFLRNYSVLMVEYFGHSDTGLMAIPLRVETEDMPLGYIIFQNRAIEISEYNRLFNVTWEKFIRKNNATIRVEKLYVLGQFGGSLVSSGYWDKFLIQ
jgi:hypothetical protein